MNIKVDIKHRKWDLMVSIDRSGQMFGQIFGPSARRDETFLPIKWHGYYQDLEYLCVITEDGNTYASLEI
jgi:hypothetical protein